jgi:phenylalanyl-tRNA synthetase beta chain
VKVPVSWLKEFVEVRVEPARLGHDLTMAGLALEGLETDGADAVLDLDITTNRVDCMNVYGVAREVAVLYGVPLRPLEVGVAEAGPPAAQALEVSIEAPDLCPRFCARVLDLRLGPSPAWLRDRLEQVGVRPINNVVDLTNYVMMEMGQPSHAFDLARVPQGRLIVRWAREGERLTTLDGVERALGTRHGVVAGGQGPLALAGVMGGAASEVSDLTRTIALEAASWNPLAVRRTARALGMHTEASHRFERGADPEGTVTATGRIAHLLARVGAGTPRPGLLDVVAAPRVPRTLVLRRSRVSGLLGVDVPEEQAQAILCGLGFVVDGREADTVRVTIPSWRGDVAREADLVEEIGRHYGLGRIPATLPPARRAEGLRPHQVRERLVREVLVGSGLSEVVNYSLVAAGQWEELGPEVRVANPLSEEQSALRRSVALPGLLSTLAVNQRQGRRDVAVFEIGRVFSPGAERPVEERRLGLLLAGQGGSGHWSTRPRDVDFFDLKGLLELLAQRLGVAAVRFEPREGLSFLQPGQAAVALTGGDEGGWVGALSPEILQRLDLRGPVYVAELGVEAMLGARPAPVRVASLPRFPSVERDLSLIVDAGTSASALESRARPAGGAILRSFTVSDRYEGPPVPAGRVSLTLRLLFQHAERTLTGEEVQRAVDAVAGALRAAGAEIRGE